MGERESVFTMMEEKKNSLITSQVPDMGIDMFPIYRRSMYKKQTPEFAALYEEYLAEILRLDNDLDKEYVRSQIQFIEEGIYVPEELGIEKYKVRPKPEVINFLIMVHYSFRIGKEFFNVPIKGVW